MRTFLIIPVLNEEKSIKKVIQDIDKNLVEEIIVVDNGSTDRTAEEAEKAGATVLHEHTTGYGNACMCGVNYVEDKNPDVVVFLDGDYSDYPQDLEKLLTEIRNGADIAVGARTKETREKGSLYPAQIAGNYIAIVLIRLLTGFKYTDLGPFRAVRFDKLMALRMEDKTYGWNVEMTLKAIKRGYRISEIPVRYRKRIGKSKISGTVIGTIRAGYKIITSIVKYSKVQA